MSLLVLFKVLHPWVDRVVSCCVLCVAEIVDALLSAFVRHSERPPWILTRFTTKCIAGCVVGDACFWKHHFLVDGIQLF